MGSHLRDLFFQLLSGLSILERLRDALGNEDVSLSDNELDRIKTLVSFLEQIRYDMHRYTTGESDLDTVFLNFLTALHLTRNPRLTRGPAYAIQSVALDTYAWSRVIKDFDDEQRQSVAQQIDDWVALLASLMEGNRDQSALNMIEGLISRFWETADRVEQRMNSHRM